MMMKPGVLDAARYVVDGFFGVNVSDAEIEERTGKKVDPGKARFFRDAVEKMRDSHGIIRGGR